MKSLEGDYARIGFILPMFHILYAANNEVLCIQNKYANNDDEEENRAEVLTSLESFGRAQSSQKKKKYGGMP